MPPKRKQRKGDDEDDDNNNIDNPRVSSSRDRMNINPRTSSLIVNDQNIPVVVETCEFQQKRPKPLLKKRKKALNIQQTTPLTPAAATDHETAEEVRDTIEPTESDLDGRAVSADEYQPRNTFDSLGDYAAPPTGKPRKRTTDSFTGIFKKYSKDGKTLPEINHSHFEHLERAQIDGAADERDSAPIPQLDGASEDRTKRPSRSEQAETTDKRERDKIMRDAVEEPLEAKAVSMLLHDMAEPTTPDGYAKLISQLYRFVAIRSYKAHHSDLALALIALSIEHMKQARIKEENEAIRDQRQQYEHTQKQIEGYNADIKKLQQDQLTTDDDTLQMQFDQMIATNIQIKQRLRSELKPAPQLLPTYTPRTSKAIPNHWSDTEKETLLPILRSCPFDKIKFESKLNELAGVLPSDTLSLHDQTLFTRAPTRRCEA